jgi:circadian clock protein KaiC
VSRARKLNTPVDDAKARSLLSIQRINPAELSAGEFSTAVRNAAEGRDGLAPARMVVIDSLNGFLNAMPEEKFLMAQLHELLAYLGQRGTVTIMSVTQSGIAGTMTSPVDTTYLADNVILFRFFEAAGRVRRAISVVKKRNGFHERSIREIDTGATGTVVGAPLAEFQGILTGVPTFEPGGKPLFVTASARKRKRRPRAALRRWDVFYGLMFKIAIALASVSTDS